jgi:type I restriction enzyme R subunit
VADGSRPAGSAIGSRRAETFDTPNPWRARSLRAPITRAERVDSHRGRVMEGLDYRQRAFLAFVLDHYVRRDVGELDTGKRPHLIALKYDSVADAVNESGPAKNIRNIFVRFRRHLC